MNKDIHYMQRALALAKLGAGTVSPNPMVGCVIIHENRIIGEGWHERYGQPHAEVNAVASVKDKSILNKATAYVTLEPCLMCAGALYWNKIGHIVFGAYDEKNSYRRVTEKNPFHPSTTLTGGILQEECAALMQSFFKAKR